MTEPTVGCEKKGIPSENRPSDQGQDRWITAGLVVLGPVFCVVTVALAVMGAAYMLLADKGATWEVVAPVVLACEIVVCTAMLGALPVALAWRFRQRWLEGAVGLGMVVRFFSTLVAVAVAMMLWDVGQTGFLLAVLGLYLVGLVGETAVAIKLIRRHVDKQA